jgi:hypothetical protein
LINSEEILRRTAGSGILQILLVHGKHVFTTRGNPFNLKDLAVKGLTSHVKNRSAPPAVKRQQTRAFLAYTGNFLVASRASTLANSVGIDGGPPASNRGSDSRTLPSASDSADDCTGSRTPCGRQLISMLLPEASTVLMPVTDASGMSVSDIAMPMPQPPASSG